MKHRLISTVLVIAMVVGTVAAAIPFAALAAPTRLPVTSSTLAQAATPIWQDPSYSYEERAADLVSRLTLSQKVAQMISSMANGGASITVDGKTIASYGWWNEALHGLSAITTANGSNAGAYNNTTSYPTDLTVASSWDPELLYREASMISDEAREVSPQNSLNLDFYSPTVNMHHDPRWGRNDESYGEDPLLAAAMAAQFVNGMQGQDMNGNLLPEGGGYLKTITTLKHYAANNSEANRLNGTATFDERASREYYTNQFRKIVQLAQPGSVMSSYNSISVTPNEAYKTPAAASIYLMDTLMRQTFGFQGYFTSDCDAVSTISGSSRQNWTPPGWTRVINTTERSAWAITAGEDLECNTGYNDSINYRTNGVAAVAANLTTPTGLFTENDVDTSLVRLFTARMKLGEFDNVATEPWVAQARARVPAGSWTNSNSNQAITETPERLAMAREVADKSIVLLKNSDTTKKDGTTGKLLPMPVPATGTFSVYVIGYFSNPSSIYLGGYSSSQGSYGVAKEVNGYNGLRNAILAINPSATVVYAKGFTGTSTSASGLTTVDATAVNNAANYDYVIVYVGTDNGTAREDLDRTTLSLPGAQASLISQVAAKNPNTIAYMETVGEVDVTPFEPAVSAMLWSSYNGMRKGEALADVVLGNYNPSGHLPFIWYPGTGSNTSVIPAITDYTLRATGTLPGRTYMYYTGALSYPFGWGLSYTTFGYSNLQIDNHNLDANDTLHVSVDVTNSGTVAGNEVVQLYVNTPDADAALQRPIKRLEGFQKVALNPGETKTVTFAVKVPDLAFFDNTLNKWAVDNGRYGIQISTSSANADIQLQDFIQVTGSLTPVPTVITVKPTQQGDAAQDIPQRVIFADNRVVVPNVTVAMNDDTLYGYILKNNSKPFPDGMTFTYSSNRPEVVSVDDSGVIRTAGGGVATVTATVTYGGVSQSTHFVIYVKADTSLNSITLDGQPLSGFSPTVFSYTMQYPDGTPVPQVAATATSPNATVAIAQATGIPGTATITVTNGTLQSVYTITFARKPNDTSLTGITVNGQALTAFSPTVFTYTGIVPSVVTDIPQVQATANNPAATVTIAQATGVPGTATVTVTASPDQTVYTVNFIRASGGSDEFSSTTLGSQWSWVRQNAATWSLTLNPGFMSIQAETGDLNTTTNTAKNILLQTPAGDWTIESKLVFSVRPATNYQQGGILVYQNDDNYIKLDWEYNGSSTRIQRIVEVNAATTTSFVAANSIIASSGSNANTVWFRIVKSGTGYRSYYSADGISFTELGTSTTPSFANPRVGLYTNNGSATTTNLRVAFDYFRVTNTGQVIKGLQTIAFPAIADKTYGDADFDPGAAASSGLAMSYSTSDNCSIVGGKVHITGAGSCTVTASQAGDSNYMPAANVSQSFNIAKANQTITFGALANKTFADLPFTVSAVASSGLAVSFIASGQCTVSGSTVTLTGAGSCTITASQPGDNNYNPAPDVAQSFNIDKAATTTTVNPASVQYSDVVTLQAAISPATANGDTTTGSVEFFINGVSVGSAAIDESGVARLSVTLTSAPGNYNVTAKFTSTNANFADSSGGPVTLTVTQEDARPVYNGNGLFWTSSVNSTSANVTLSAAILDITAVDSTSDPNAGDIRNAKVTFINRDTNTAFPGCSNLPVGLVNAGDLKTGTATCNTTLTADKTTGATQYTVGIVVSGYYARNSTEDDTIVTVAQPIPSNFITGGGHLVLSSSAGQMPGTAGSKANFGFNVKYTKSGTNLQGNVNIIVRSGGHVYKIKGTALSSLGVAGTAANFSGKANITDITNPLNPISVDGNATLQLWMTDNGEPGTGDTLGIQVLSKNGGTWFSSNWSGTKTVEQALGGGNLSVH